MSQAASQAAAFYRDVARSRAVWTVKDAGGYPAPMTSSGQRAQPFWSSKSRVEKIISSVEACAGFAPVEIPWEEFCQFWAPGLTNDGLLVGVNWSGPRALGYDIAALEVQRNVEAVIAQTQATQE
jgi:hypothetical protein